MTQEQPAGAQDDRAAPVVVGIGASAGGLSALRELFTIMPAHTGLAFVVVVHLSPEHESHLADLLQHHCDMPVEQVTDTLPLVADHVYVIAPGRNLSTIDSHLRVSDLEASASHRAPIDHFFRTLAGTHDSRAIGVVLTGTGSDGTAGLEMIKDAGGLTIAQDPAEAEFDGMPRAAIASGYIDHVLALSDIPDRIVSFATTEPQVEVSDDEPSEDVLRGLRQVLNVVRQRSGHDLSGYKHATIIRRLRRRMQLHRCVQVDHYLDLLREDPDEALHLFTDLLISVTNFFRDPEVFDAIEQQVIPQMLRDKGPEDTVRVWSVGCSTGEEPYSLAILLLEATERMDDPPLVQVFATDLHDHSLRRAREGYFPELIGADVSQERLQRFFTRETDGFRVRKEVREVVIFAPHDLLRDPPFSHLDMVTCRNLLIYLRRDLQQQVINLFHYALDPGGYLVLGSSETIDHSELFVAEDKSNRLFRRRDVAGPEPALPVFSTAMTGTPERAGAGRAPASPHQQRFGGLHEQMAEQYAPPSVLVNEDQHILHYSAHAGEFLVHPGGDPTTDVVRLVREELRIELRAALAAAREDTGPSASRPVTLDMDGEKRHIVIRVRPATDHDGLRGLYLVIFDDIALEPAAGGSPNHPGAGPATVELETELDLTKQRLQALITEYETGQEEMKASNEEMQSSNEELRSTLEELETSKEELQSVNEELTTLNQENRYKVEELRLLSGDLQNLLVGTDIATLFLDRQLRIMRFTPRIGDLFNIINSDRGRPLTDITHRLGYPHLHTDALEVLERLVPIEREVPSEDGSWFLTRVLPYRTSDDHIEGVVITFIDITRRRRAEAALRDSEQRLRLALDASQMGAWTWDLPADTFSIDGRTADILGLRGDENMSPARLVNEIVDPADRAVLQSAIDRSVDEHDSQPFSLEVRLRRRDMSTAWVLLSGQGYGPPEAPDRIRRVTGTMLDVTDRKETEQSLNERVEAQTEVIRQTEHRFRALVEASSQIVWTTDAEGFIVDDSPQWRDFTGQDLSELRGSGWLDAVHPGDRVVVAETWREAIAEQTPFHAEFRVRHAPTDSWHWVSARAVPLDGPSGSGAGWVGMVTDIDQRRRAEDKIRVLASTLTMAEHEERRRIAQVLHDDLQQRLYSIQMRAGILRQDDGGLATDTVDRGLTEIEEWVASSIELTHRLTIDLSPPILEHEGLAEALEWLATQMKEMHDLDVHVHASESFPISDEDMRVFLFHIVRELLFNVVKHAGVDEATVDLRRKMKTDLQITVTDDGAGFDASDEEPRLRPTGGLGLSSGRERLGLFGGRMEIESAGGAGTTVTVTIPLAREET